MQFCCKKPPLNALYKSTLTFHSMYLSYVLSFIVWAVYLQRPVERIFLCTECNFPCKKIMVSLLIPQMVFVLIDLQVGLLVWNPVYVLARLGVSNWKNIPLLQLIRLKFQKYFDVIFDIIIIHIWAHWFITIMPFGIIKNRCLSRSIIQFS